MLIWNLDFIRPPHNLWCLSLICERFSIFLFIVWTIKNSALYLSIQIRCYHDLYYLQIWSTSFDFWTQHLWFMSEFMSFFMPNAVVQIMYFLSRNLNVSSNMGATHSITWLWLYSDAVSSYFFLHGFCVCSLFRILHLLFIVFQEGQQISEGSWGQW